MISVTRSGPVISNVLPRGILWYIKVLPFCGPYQNSSIEFVKNKLTLFANLIKSFDKFSLLMGDISLVDEELIELVDRICK